jgi:siroheme synthase
VRRLPPGATGATLAIHLAIHALDQVVAELAPSARIARSPCAGELPRSRWCGDAATIAAAVAADPIDRTAVIFVSPGLAARVRRARSDAAYQRLRGRGGWSRAIARLAPALRRSRRGGVARGAGPRPRLPDARGDRSAAAATCRLRRAGAPEALGGAAALHFVGKRRGRPSTPQAEINALLVRLAGGDCRCCAAMAIPASSDAGARRWRWRGREWFRFLPGVTRPRGAASARISCPRGTNKALILATGHKSGRPTADWRWRGQAAIVILSGWRDRRDAAALIAGASRRRRNGDRLGDHADSGAGTISRALPSGEGRDVHSPALIVIGARRPR